MQSKTTLPQDNPLDRLCDLLLSAGIEIFGLDATASWFKNGPNIRSWQSYMFLLYGDLGSCGAAFRTGRGAWSIVAREYGSRMGITNLEFRLQPFNRRIRTSLTGLASIIEEMTGSKVRISSDEKSWYWSIDQFPHNPVEVRSPLIYFLAGLVQELVIWSGAGRNNYSLDFIPNSPGSFKINRRPVE